MSEVKVSQPHNVSVDEARQKVQGFETMVQKYGVTSSWSGNQATLKGTGVSGSITIQPRSVDVVVKLGMMARAFGVDPAKLESSIRKRLKEAFEGGGTDAAT
jgi:putative polyhydroxyalkanoate system protein